MGSTERTELWEAIDSSDYLFLNKLFEPRDNSLTIVLEQAIANVAKIGPTILPGGLKLPGDSCPIEPTADCLIFTLHWKLYVSYCVTEEMVGSCGNYQDADYTGRLLRVYSKSAFLDFIAKSTGAHSDPYRHYMIACQNHNIDIVSTREPELSSMSRAEAGLE
jgi:hypothetical protein